MRYLIPLVFATSLVGAQARPTVAAFLAGAAKGSPIEFATALARATVPAGLELREADDVLPSAWPPAFKVGDKLTAPLDDVLAAFNGQRQDYRAVVVKGGAVVIRPAQDRLPFLDARSDIASPVTVTGIMAAARRVFTPLDAKLAGPIAGSGSLKGKDVRIVLDGSGGRTVIDTLNQIAAQAPGHVWVVTTRKEGDTVRITGFGYIHGDGSRDKRPMDPAGT